MASSSSLLLIAAVALLISRALSLTCTFQTFSNPNTTFAHCMDLPTLNATLHWTHDPTATPSTLSVAFTVPTAANTTKGWVAWALNPTQTGMLGAQALIATPNGSTYVVNTYNISSYKIGAPSNISYNVLSSAAEAVNGSTIIFAKLLLPADAKPVLNQVWQVGPVSSNGAPTMHGTTHDNLGSKTNLTLSGAAAETPAGSPSGSPSDSPATPGPTAGGQGGNSTSGGARVCGNGLYGVVLVLLWASYFGLF
ncbi:hypothetical protein CASFOL_022757 [Castilleja foliolosa]|uniref:DOMON domain-containing protein n=1 Tax=Castilleja foliolosa TaxID=1961234 RepID=A0ABD3CTC7_9LAMI